MQDYRNILLATDLSKTSATVAQRARTLAHCLDAKLTLLYVVEGFPEDLPVKWVAPENEDPKMYLQARATEELRALAEQAACPDAALQVVFCDRGPCREITRYAKEQGVDLIIMSSRGHQGIKRNLGSKVGTVIDDADCDVLTVHSAE